nr:hypothetical protein [Treponema sp.]
MKTKRIHFFASSIALLLTAFAFFSCSQTNQTGTATLSTTISTASFAQTVTETGENAYTLEVSISGEYKETQRANVSETENSKTFEFQEIPVGAEIKLSAKLLSGDETIYSGETSIFSVKAGENRVKLSMKKAQETVWIVLWNRSTTEKKDNDTTENTYSAKGMSAFKEDSISSAEITETNSLTTYTIDSFAFSDDGDLYTLEHYKNVNSATVYEIGQYKKTSTGYEEGVSKDLSALMESIEANGYTPLEITCHGDYIYVMCNSSSYTGSITVYTTKIGVINLSNFENAESFDTIATISSINATNIAVTDNALFLTTSNEVYSFDDYTAGANYNKTRDSFDPIASFTDYGKSIADLHAQDGYLYGLLSYSEMNKTTKGGVFKIDTSKKTLCNWSNGSSLLGWNDTASDTPHGSCDYFFNPTNFIATSPKKLVISDDGCRESSDDDDTAPNNENRVVTIDLETEAMTATDVNVMFDNEKIGCGCTQASAD